MKPARIFTGLFAAVAAFAAPLCAQTLVGAPRPSPGVVTVAIPIACAAPLAEAPSFLAIRAPALSAPVLESAPGVAVAAPARPAPSALGSGFAEMRAPEVAILGDPVLTEALLARSRRFWDMASPAQPSREEALSRALEAADYTGAREVLRSASASARKEFGLRAFRASGLPEELAHLERRLDLPDHPEIASLRSGLEEVRNLKENGRIARAMVRVSALLEEYGDGIVSRTPHHNAFLTPLIHFKTELHKLGLDVYLANADSRELGLDLKGSGVRDWFMRRRAADRDSVAGSVSSERVAVQKWSDCAMQALWNLPALRSLRSRMTYERFLASAEKLLGSPVRREGLSESGEARLLERLGWRRSYNRTPRGERDLVDSIRNYDGVLGSYDFPMSRWKAFFGIGSLGTRFAHGVAITAAVHDQGRWWFVVLDSGHPYPRVLSYGELLTMGLKIAIVTPSR